MWAKDYKLITRTPIWTGSAQPNMCDRIHEASIIGGLRYWYEVILRSLDYSACDPTYDLSAGADSAHGAYGRCPESRKVNNTKKQYWCDACDLFGCTGWRRRFNLTIEDGDYTYSQQTPEETLRLKPDDRNTGWFRGAGRISCEENGGLALRLVCLDHAYQDLISSGLSVALRLCQEWTGIGARLQHGFGVVDMGIPANSEKFDKFLTELKKTKCRKSRRDASGRTSLPSLNDFFFCKVQFQVDGKSQDWWKGIDGCQESPSENVLKDYIACGSIPLAPAIKSLIRYGLSFSGGHTSPLTTRSRLARVKADDIFGTVTGIRKGCRIAVSDAYPVGEDSEKQFEFRVWGWISEREIKKGIREIIQEAFGSDEPFKKLLGKSRKSDPTIIWREIDCDQCPGTRYRDAKSFIRCLLSS